MTQLPSHSKVGASSMSRWSECPGSVRLSEGVDNPASEHAAEGTVAHWVGETVLRGEKHNPHDLIGTVKEQEGFKIEVTEEMCDAVQVYIDAIDADRHAGESNEIEDYLVEHRFHLADLHAGLFGTSDCVLYDPKEMLLRVYDYKHGRGVLVEVDDNPQLLYYALGAMMTTDYKVSQVEMVIVQPRCPHPDGPVRRSKRIDAIDLLDWSADLVEYVKATEDPDAKLAAGNHCTFCPAKAICPEIHSKALEAAKTTFDPVADADNYDADKLAEILEWLPVFEKWIKGVREFAYGEAMQGRTPPRQKLVQKRATRKFRDEAQAAAELMDYGLDERDLYTRKLKTPAQIEKVVGKSSMNSDLGHLVVSESSGYTLVPETDNREAVQPMRAEDVFDSV